MAKLYLKWRRTGIAGLLCTTTVLDYIIDNFQSVKKASVLVIDPLKWEWHY